MTDKNINVVEIAEKLKKELPLLVQPNRSDYALVELYDDIMHLVHVIDPTDTTPTTYNILRKYIPQYPEQGFN